MTAVVEFVIRAAPREEASDALRAQLRALNQANIWDTSDATVLRLLSWLRRPEAKKWSKDQSLVEASRGRSDHRRGVDGDRKHTGR